MTDSPQAASRARETPARKHLQKRYRAERRFRHCGVAAIAFALFALCALFASILLRALPAFTHFEVWLDLRFDAALLELDELETAPTREDLAYANYDALLRAALEDFFHTTSATRAERRERTALLSNGASFELRDALLENPALLGRSARFRLPLSDDADLYFKGELSAASPENTRRLDDRQLRWLDTLADAGRVERTFARRFFLNGDSREPELAGVLGAALGTFWTLLVTLLLSFPVGVAAATYLEEFAPKGRVIDWVEININNLAAVPSIVFGLLGLALFLNVFGLPRSAPLAGGMVLALMTLPTIIIAARAALGAVPPSIREAALGVGASPLQVVTHHVLPLALPGILTGAILGMARALGETAPLLMIGMVAFIVDLPGGPLDSATTLPVQVFLWADSPERALVARTAAAILVLLTFLLAMNLAAVLLRHRFERRW